MKKYFFTGLAILLPVTLTIVVVSFIINLLTKPFLDLSHTILQHFFQIKKGFLFFSTEQLETILSQLFILVVLVGGTILLGIAARWVFFHYLIQFWEYIIHKIPLVGTIYRTFKDVITTIFGDKTTAFKQVVLVRFPTENTYAIGLVTRDGLPEFEKLGPDLMVVFVPTTPNPTSGFLTVYHKDQVTFLDMKVEDAFKYIISCGVITPNFRKGTPT